MRARAIVAIILALTVVPVSADTVYIWQNSSGETEYGQFPPTGVETRVYSLGAKKSLDPADEDDQTAQADTAASPQEQVRLLEEEQAKQASAAAAQADVAEREALYKSNCANARNDLAVLQKGGHRRVRLPDGSVTFLTAEQSQERITAARAHIETYCR